MDNKEINIFVEEAEKNRIPPDEFPTYREIVDEVMAVFEHKILPNTATFDKEKVEWSVSELSKYIDGKKIRLSDRERDFLEKVVAVITKKRLGVKRFAGG